MTTLTLLTHPRSLFAPGPPRRGFLLGFAATFLLGVLLLVGASIGVALGHAERIMPGVRVAGIEVGGMTRAEAAGTLTDQLPSLADGSVTLRIAGATVPISYAELTLGYDLDSIVDEAFGVARGGGPLGDGIARLRTLVHASDVAPIAAMDRDTALDAVVNDLVERFAAAPLDASVGYSDSAGFVVREAVVGRSLDADTVRAALAGVVAAPRADATITLVPQAVQPEVSTADATVAARAAGWMADSPLILRVGETALSLAPADLSSLISFAQRGDGYVPVVDREALAALVEPLAPTVAKEPTNASFTWGPNGITGVLPGTPGRELDVDASVRNALDALGLRGDGSYRAEAALVVVSKDAALTTDAATAAVPNMRRLGTWTTYYVPGEGNFWGANISIPAHDLDKLTLAPGEWFSFWDDIGPMTIERGYGYGGAIIGGRSVRNGAIGGGVCSTSTTLFNAAMRSGLEIGERTNHSYYISRYPTGLDATVLKTDTSETDMTFRNDTSNPVVIRAYTGSGWVRFDIWGVPDGRTVSLSAPVTSNHGVARETVVVNPNLRPGTSVRVEYLHNGFRAVVTRTVRAADGTVLHLDTWVSNYRTINGITEVGPSVPATPPPATPAPTPTPTG